MSDFTREDMVDAIATAISDSFDVDWNSRTGAEAVVRNCGVFELFEALSGLCDGMDELDRAVHREAFTAACAALRKVRGEQ